MPRRRMPRSSHTWGDLCTCGHTLAFHGPYANCCEDTTLDEAARSRCQVGRDLEDREAKVAECGCTAFTMAYAAANDSTRGAA